MMCKYVKKECSIFIDPDNDCWYVSRKDCLDFSKKREES